LCLYWVLKKSVVQDSVWVKRSISYMNTVVSKYRHITPDRIIFILGCLITFISALGPLFYSYIYAPAGTHYRFADGYFFDYYHYLMMIKGGMMGYFGYFNRVSEIVQPVSYGHAIYSLAGMISAIFGLYRTDIVYLIMRIGFLIGLFVVMDRAIRVVFSNSLYRVACYVLFFTSTSGYVIERSVRGLRAIEPITFSGYYNALAKFPAPPQHVLASTLLLTVALIGFRRTSGSWGQYGVLALIAFLIGMVQPFLCCIGVLTCWFVTVWGSVSKSYSWRDAITPALVYTLASMVPIGYYLYLSRYIPPWTLWANLTLNDTNYIDFFGYIVANVMFLPFFVLLIPHVRKLPRHMMFFVGWGAVVPTLLFLLTLQVPSMSQTRLLQVQQYIPLCIISIYGLERVFGLTKRTLQKSIISVFCFLAIVYAVVPWYTTIMDSLYWKDFTTYNVFIPDDYMDVLSYLEQHTPAQSVVLSGEYISMVIPAFTHNRTIVGRQDVTADYGEKLAGLQQIFGFYPEVSAVQTYLSRYHIAYVIFGLDMPVFTQPYSEYTFFRPVYKKGGITLVEVSL
jgi:hypothetical protein